MRTHTRHPVELFAAVNVYVLRKRFKTYSMLEARRLGRTNVTIRELLKEQVRAAV